MHFVCGLWFDYDFADALLLAVPYECSVFFLDPLQNVRCARSPAAVREDRVSQAEFSQRYLAAAEKCRWIGAKRRTNTRRGAKLQHRIDTRIHPDADRCAILRFHQRLPGGHWTFVTVIGILGSPFAENSRCTPDHHCAIIQWRIFDHRTRIHSSFKSRRINERQHCRADGAPRL